MQVTAAGKEIRYAFKTDYAEELPEKLYHIASSLAA